MDVVDRGWAWMVLLGSSVQIYLLNAWVSNYGQFFVEIQTMTGCSAADAAWIATINYITLCFFSPLASWLSARVNYRPVIMTGSLLITCSRLVAAMFLTSLPAFTITLGFLDGIGEAMTFGPSLASLSLYFRRRLGIAMGLCLGSCGLSILTSVPITAFFLKQSGFRQTLFLHTCLAAQGIVAGALIFPRHDQLTKTTDTEINDAEMELNPVNINLIENHEIADKKVKHKCVTLSPTQILQIIVYGFSCITMMSGPKYIAPHCKDLNIPLSDTSWILSLGGVADMVAKIGTGPFCDLKFIQQKVKTYRLYSLSMILMASTNFILPSLQTYTAVFINCILMAFCCGVFNLLSVVATVDLVGRIKYGPTFAAMLLAASVFLFLDILVVARLRDVTGSYRASFYFLGASAILAAILSLFHHFTSEHSINDRMEEINIEIDQ